MCKLRYHVVFLGKYMLRRCYWDHNHMCKLINQGVHGVLNMKDNNMCKLIHRIIIMRYMMPYYWQGNHMCKLIN